MKKLLLLGLSWILLASCAPKASSVKQTEFMLNTVCTITVYNEKNKDKTAEELVSEAFELCSDYEKLFSRTIDGSDVYNINHSNGNPTTVSDSTVEILKLAQFYSDLSDGAFDITIEPLSELWNFEGDNPHVPPKEEIEGLLKDVDYTKVKLDGNEVTLEPPVRAIDLGGIAKGYIADKLAEFLKENGVTSAMISLGGNLYAIGENETESRPFNLGIQDPFAEDGSILGYVTVSDCSLVTSGDYQRYFVQDGIRYHHILDPSTGYPTVNELSSVTIISKKSADADALSTACFVLGIEKGMNLINSLDDVEAVFVDKDKNMSFSDGFKNDLSFTYSEE